MASDTKASVAVGRVVAGVAGAVDYGDAVAGVAVDTECGRGHRGHMVVDVVIEILGMAIGAGAAANNRRDARPVIGVFKGRRRSVAVPTEIFVDGKRVVGRMADRDAALVIKQNTGSKVVDRGVH